MNRRLMLTAAVCALTAFAVAVPVEAGGSQEKVKIAAKAGKIDADGKQVITISIAIEDDWYAYANPVKFDLLDDAATEIRIKSKAKLKEVKVAYPAGEAKEDNLGGKKVTYQVYKKKVEIPATVVRAPGDTGPLEVSVILQTCNAKTKVCLPPANVKLTVP